MDDEALLISSWPEWAGATGSLHRPVCGLQDCGARQSTRVLNQSGLKRFFSITDGRKTLCFRVQNLDSTITSIMMT